MASLRLLDRLSIRVEHYSPHRPIRAPPRVILFLSSLTARSIAFQPLFYLQNIINRIQIESDYKD